MTTIVIVFIISIVLNALANILMKAGAIQQQPADSIIAYVWQMGTNIYILSGVLCFGLALGAYNFVLGRINLSVAYPINTSLGYVLVILASWLLFKESLGIAQIGGIGLIVAGVWLVAQ